MKKNIIIYLFVLVTGGLIAQNSVDALRYSQDELNGTARYKAMSGAFGALGGDLSAMAQNPAGSSVFNTGEIGFTLGNTKINNSSTFFGETEKLKGSEFNMGQLGTVFVFRNYSPDSSWKKFSIGFNYQNKKSFEGRNLSYSGVNSQASLADYFGNFVNGFSYSDLQTYPQNFDYLYRKFGMEPNGWAKQQAFLGVNGNLLSYNPTSGYHNNDKLPVTQIYLFEQYGSHREYTFNFSGQYNDNIYLGLNLNSHVINYSNFRGLEEKRYPTSSNVQYAKFENNLRTQGGGFSLQLGAIVKATKDLRVGVTYQSPTWYTLRDETDQFLSTDVDDGTHSNTFITTDINPNVTNIYEEYKLRTPSQWTGSVAYLFGKKGLLSLDYIYKGYGNMQFTELDGKIEANKAIETLFTDTNSIRIGGEFRATPQFSIRAGYRFEQSPYKDKKLMGNLNGYSFGLGYNFGGLTLDFAYDFAHRDFQYQMYNVGLTNRANVKSDNYNLLLTLSMKL